MPVISLDTSYSSSRSSGYNQQYDQIPFKMADEHQLFCSRDAHSPSRPQNLPLYGCQSLRLGGSFRTDESILSWSLIRRPITAPCQHVRNDCHSLRTDKSLKYIHHSCVLIATDNTTVVSYQQARGNTFSQPMHRGMEDTSLVPKIRLSSVFIISQANSMFWQTGYQNRVAIGSIDCEFNFTNAQLSQSGSICDTLQSQASTLCVPVLDNQAFAIDAFSMNWNYLHAYTFPPTIMIPSVLDKIRQSQCRIVLIAPLWPQQTWFSEVLHLLVSAPVHLPLFPNLLTQAKGKFRHQNLPALNLHAWELSNNQLEKKSSENIADFVSKSRRTSTQKVCDAKWIVYTRWCHRRKINPVSAPLTVIADFLIYLFSEKKYQISTIKGYRSMISNTPKFKTGKRV